MQPPVQNIGMKQYKRLSPSERDQLAIWKAEGVFKSIGAEGPNIHFALGDLKYTDGTDEAGWCQYVKDKINEGAGKSAGDGFIPNFVQCLPDRLVAVGQYGAEYYLDYENTRFIMIPATGGTLPGGWGHKYIFSTDDNVRYKGKDSTSSVTKKPQLVITVMSGHTVSS